ncbi:hypothetical protein [Xanthomarina sp. F2636L]|uniref:hypothetical protein n=1 Tax=Xanthomarina sp. F2636L TaxID=2996018 RepID=UPI00225E6930|nr:hypothetical protein [Xanthomarina sp. F2636L]MCX7549808.1 hypothetical protein [Xanthomarina sp. F2636L]
MKPIIESYLSRKTNKTYNLKIGNFYFFENFVVVEYAEDSLVSMAALQTIKTIGLQHYGTKSPFGMIVNKIHSYNTVPTDAMKLEKEVPNLIATAIVSKDLTKTINFDLENHFFKHINRRIFSTLEDAEKWIVKKVEEHNS